MKVTLVGFMGAGKTTIGKLLSERLKTPFLDLDELIVEQVGMSIPEIFKKKGENEFRKIESSILKELLYQNRSFVLSTGGGTPTYLNNMELINQNSISVFLRTDFKTTWRRISSDENRPLVLLGKEKLLKLYLKRLPFYFKAKLIIDATFLSPVDTVLNIIKVLKSC
ncbi:shikimate kinase [Balnearium lithotrophicum]|uniref:Shikimate kinase n=1 Tax=Balnearium lithotrophicum TaxID=223788 RepID=A0A521DV09_9BACT|nr:shikimate kinase [Balnearium lithotrophicum]SMO75546.1 shikimate kinase [Balnearium lithotrophicum]